MQLYNSQLIEKPILSSSWSGLDYKLTFGAIANFTQEVYIVPLAEEMAF